jgi:hypothetical protein
MLVFNVVVSLLALKALARVLSNPGSPATANAAPAAPHES